MIVQETLGSGLTLVTEAMPELRSVAIGVWLRRGSRHEAREASGVSHFIEHMVFKGTKHRSAERIAAEVDSIGGYMDAFTAKEYASFHLKVLDEHLPLAVEILGTRGSVSRFKREDLASYFTRVYRPDNILIAAAGHLEHGALAALVGRHFAGVARRGKAGRAPASASRPPAVACRSVTRSKRELEQV